MKLKLIWHVAVTLQRKRAHSSHGGVLAIGRPHQPALFIKMCEFATELLLDVDRGRLAP
jgi:hypothetical protein